MMLKHGLYWHVHHERLFEYCYAPQRRIAYIKKEKPKEEIATRLRLMRPVKGKLGDAKAWAAYYKAGAAYGKAWAAYVKAWADYGKAWAAYVKAGAAYYKAGETWEATVKPSEAEALHAKECKNCPWNGETIFPSVRVK